MNRYIIDAHELWKDINDNNPSKYHVAHALENASKRYGMDQLLYNRTIRINSSAKHKKDWVSLLKKHMHKHIVDYSFDRVDNRFTDVLLPDLRPQDLALNNVWFLIDVSGSMDNSLIVDAYHQITMMIKQIKYVKGQVSFFSTKVTKPKSIQNIRDLNESISKIDTTGGTDFNCIFKTINEYFRLDKPKIIIILTDGFGRVDKEVNPNIPVIWVINQTKAHFPFGDVIYI